MIMFCGKTVLYCQLQLNIELMGFFDPYIYPTFKENYEYGFPEYEKTQTCVVQFRPEGVRFQFFGILNGKKILIHHADILEVGLNTESYRSAGKAAVGAILGGLATGGVGLIAGAALGGRRRKENQLVLAVKYGGRRVDLYFTPNSNTEKLYREFKKVFSPDNVQVTLTDRSFASELEHLAELRDRGILTEEEFKAQKTKLL